MSRLLALADRLEAWAERLRDRHWRTWTPPPTDLRYAELVATTLRSNLARVAESIAYNNALYKKLQGNRAC